MAMLEHSNFVVWCDRGMLEGELILNHGTFLTIHVDEEKNRVYIGGNLTAWCKSFLNNTTHGLGVVSFFSMYGDIFGKMTTEIDPLWNICSTEEVPDELKRYTTYLVCDRGVTHELVRHRVASFAQESTRYVDYKKASIEFIKPWWYLEKDVPKKHKDLFEASLKFAEKSYKALRAEGVSPQGARAVLPCAAKSEIIVTADSKEWRHIFNLRLAASAHPDMRVLMSILYKGFLEAGFL